VFVPPHRDRTDALLGDLVRLGKLAARPVAGAER
jgi:hypothetical protein